MRQRAKLTKNRPAPSANAEEAERNSPRPSFDQLIAALGEVENATLVTAPPPSTSYSWELKYDGYRILAFKLGKEVRLISRRGQDWTDDFRDVGLRADKRPEDCVREGEVGDTLPLPSNQSARRKQRSTRPRSQTGAPTIAGVAISNADRILDPLPLSKLALARYYEAIGEWMLPHVQGRPLTLVRWAEGKPTEKGGVYLRHRKAWGPNVLRRVHIREQKKIGEYLVIDDVAGLVGLTQMDILEIHTWNSSDDDVERPNRVVFDLDPDPAVDWAAVMDTARTLRIMLQAIGLESWLKTMGGKGLHLVVPIVPEHDWTTVSRRDTGNRNAVRR